jgi:micrococcal nuclease
MVGAMRRSRLPSLGSLLLLAAGIAILLAGGDDGSTSADDRLPGRLEARVVAVVDGDTARMLVDGREESVRYIGIDTPESAIPGERPECFGKRAAHANASLVEGKTVTLVLGDERRDRYGRLLAYVYLGERFVNAEILRRGLARTLAIAPNIDFADRLAAIQRAAANAGRGLWGEC